MYLFRFIIVLITLAAVSSCMRWDLRHSDHEYLTQEQIIHPIIVPPGISMPSEQQLYAVPNIPVPAKRRPVSLIPPGCKMKGKNKGQD